jgi:hypothetical protein
MNFKVKRGRLAGDCLVGAVTTRETFFKPRERSGPKLIHRGAIVAFEVSLCVKLKHLFIPSFDCSVRSHGFRGGFTQETSRPPAARCACRASASAAIAARNDRRAAIPIAAANPLLKARAAVRVSDCGEQGNHERNAKCSAKKTCHVENAGCLADLLARYGPQDGVLSGRHRH